MADKNESRLYQLMGIDSPENISEQKVIPLGSLEHELGMMKYDLGLGPSTYYDYITFDTGGTIQLGGPGLRMQLEFKELCFQTVSSQLFKISFTDPRTTNFLPNSFLYWGTGKIKTKHKPEADLNMLDKEDCSLRITGMVVPELKIYDVFRIEVNAQEVGSGKYALPIAMGYRMKRED